MKVTLKAARINKGLTQEDLATALKVTKKTVGSWEMGKTMPKIDKIQLLCALLDCSYDDIIWNV